MVVPLCAIVREKVVIVIVFVIRVLRLPIILLSSVNVLST